MSVRQAILSTSARNSNYLNNRKTKTSNGAILAYVYDAANQLKEIHQTDTTGPLTAAFVYDANGGLIQKCEGGGVTTTTSSCTGSTTGNFVYDALSHLVQANKTGQASQAYVYDDQGRRISKSVGSVTTAFLYNGPDIVAEYAHTWAAPIAQYTHGPNQDDPIERITPTLAQYFHQNGIGSVVAVSNNSNSAVDFQSFDAWGNQTALSGTQPRYGYTGREPDETGLIYYRARYYDPTIGRFTQRDPIGIEGGINLYGYTGNNPVNFTDPSGECPWCIGAASSVILGGVIRGLTGGDIFDAKAIAVDAALGAVGAGLASKVGRVYQEYRALQVGRSQYLGDIGERAAGIAVKNETKISSVSGKRYTVPDDITTSRVIESKNKLRLSSGDSRQIADEVAYAKDTGRQAELYTRRSTVIDSGTQESIDSGDLLQKFLPNIGDDGFRVLSPLESGAAGAGFGQGTQALYNFVTGDTASPYSGNAQTGFNPRAKK